MIAKNRVNSFLNLPFFFFIKKEIEFSENEDVKTSSGTSGACFIESVNADVSIGITSVLIIMAVISLIACIALCIPYNKNK